MFVRFKLSVHCLGTHHSALLEFVSVVLMFTLFYRTREQQYLEARANCLFIFDLTELFWVVLEAVVTLLILGAACLDVICINLFVLFGAFMECVELRLVEGIGSFFVRQNDDVVG